MINQNFTEQRKRVALITGGSRGIGAAIVKSLAQTGYNIAFCYKENDKAADEILAYLIENNCNALKIKCDVSDFSQVQNMYVTLKKHFGFIDTVVNNAAEGHYKLFLDETEKDFEQVINNNLKSVFNVCSAFAPDMVSEKFGRIINIASMWGQTGASMETLYSMSKAGVIGFTKALSKELAVSGVTVNAVSPGLIDTDMNKRFTKTEMKDIIDLIPANKIGTPAEVAAAVVFLADVKSSYITGQVLGVNGGII